MIDEDKQGLSGEETNFEGGFEDLGPMHGRLHLHFVQPNRALSDAHRCEDCREWTDG